MKRSSRRAIYNACLIDKRQAVDYVRNQPLVFYTSDVNLNFMSGNLSIASCSA